MVIIFKKKFLRLCLNPEIAYEKKYADFAFVGMILPCVAFILFALNVGIERASYIPSYSAIKIMLLAFIGIGVGVFSAGLTAVIGFLSGKIVKKEINGIYFLCCVEFSFTIAVIIEFIGLIMKIFGANISSVFGIVGIFSAVAMSFAILRSFIKSQNAVYVTACTVIGLVVMLGMNIIFFIPV